MPLVPKQVCPIAMKTRLGRAGEEDFKTCWSKEVLTKATTKGRQRGPVMWSHTELIPEDCVARPVW